MHIVTGLPRYNRVTFDRANEGEGGGSNSAPEQDRGPNDDALDNFIKESDNLNDGTATQDAGETGDGTQEGEHQGAPRQREDRQGAAQNEGSQQGQEPQQGSNRAQDLTLRDGTVIKGGAERRLYEKNQQLQQQFSQQQQQLQRAQQENQQLRGSIQAYEKSNSAATQLGLSPQDVHVGLQITAAYKKDPIQTINYLLTEAKAAGYDTSKIGGGGVDTAAITRIVQQELAPITQNHRAQQEQQRIQQESEQTAQRFFNQYPDAQMHENEIAELISREPSLTPETAYFALQNFFLKNGLDWNKPLPEQLQARQGAQNGQRQQSMPTGRQSGGANPPTQEFNPARDNSSDDLDELIRGAMREAALQEQR